MPTQDRSGADHRELLVLLAARRSGVLDALATTAGTPGEVAAETDVSEHAAHLLVSALADRGFLREVGGEYQPTNRMLGFITKTDVRSVGRLPHALDVLEDWLALPETMRTGTAPARGDDWPHDELGAAAARDNAEVRAAVTAAVREHPGAERVLVLADAAGRHAVDFAERGFDVTLLDVPAITEVNRASLGGKAVDLVAGDPLSDLPPADLVFASGLLRRYGEADARRLFGNARAALGASGDRDGNGDGDETGSGSERKREHEHGRTRDGGGVAVFLDAVRGETPDAALVALDTFARRGGGDCYDAATLTDWLADAGFAGRVEPVPGLADRAVVGRAID